MNEWMAFAYGFSVLFAMVCFVTAILDMGMNGARYAGWAPWGLGFTLVFSLIGAMLVPA
jgi:hypothetical protein